MEDRELRATLARLEGIACMALRLAFTAGKTDHDGAVALYDDFIAENADIARTLADDIAVLTGSRGDG